MSRRTPAEQAREWTPVQLDPRRDPWERQPAETGQAFEAFQTYRNMGANRALRKTSQELDKAEALITRWSRRWRWSERVDAWDRHLDEEYRSELIEQRRQMGRRHARIAQGVMGKVVERLQTMSASELSPGQLIQAFETAAKVERMALGAADTVVAHVGDQGGPIRHHHASDDQVADAARDFLQQLMDEGPRPGEVVDAEVIEELPAARVEERTP